MNEGHPYRRERRAVSAYACIECLDFKYPKPFAQIRNFIYWTNRYGRVRRFIVPLLCGHVAEIDFPEEAINGKTG